MKNCEFPENYWLGQKKAAISINYDDGYQSCLDNAIPQLEEAGFRGTFYLHIENPHVQNNISRWKEAFENGHDVSNHSMTHPCGTRLLSMTEEQLTYEIGGAEQWLIDNIGYDEYRSFAYPCTEIDAGGATITPGAIISKEFRDKYLGIVKATYMSSRTGFGKINTSFCKLSIDQHEIDGKAIQFPHATDVAEFIEYCESALEVGGWAVIIFHGVGDDNMPADLNVHQDLINYLRENEDKYWVAPNKDVVKYIRENPEE